MLPTSSKDQSSSKPPAPTCERCRKRKVKCVPRTSVDIDTSAGITDPAVNDLLAPCKSCDRRKESCSFNYTHKKPGRPRKTRSSDSRSRSPSRKPPSTQAAPSEPAALNKETPFPIPEYFMPDIAFLNDSAFSPPTGKESTAFPPSVNSNIASTSTNPMGDSSVLPSMPAANSFFGSARQTLASPANFAFDFSLPVGTGDLAPAAPIDNPLSTYWYEPIAANDNTILPTADDSELQQFFKDIGQTPLSYLSDSPNVPVVNTSNMAGDLANTYQPILTNPIDPPMLPPLSAPTRDRTNQSLGVRTETRPPQIEETISWGDVSFFISLHVKYQHALVPLCHQPTFAKDILHRRDQTDEAFRCFLYSIVAYTICQCPVHLLTAHMSRENLESLLRRCQRASRVIQIRHQMKPSLVILASTIMDWITSQASTSVELSDNLFNDVRRIVYRLNLHHVKPREGINLIELELCRRIFWEAYVIDKTNALNGHPFIFHDMDGLPPLPNEVDDDVIGADATMAGQQPSSRVSYIVGFNAIAKIFRLVYQCLWSHREFVREDQMPKADRVSLEAWIEATRTKLDSILSGLPLQLRPDFGSEKPSESGSQNGMQAANILITALCLQLALLDFQSILFPESDTSDLRRQTAHRVLSDLGKIPIQCLALNGESMRGKVLRVVLALLNASGRSTGLAESAWDWWGMYSRVQFLQIIPASGLPIVVPTRPQSPS